MTDEKKERSAEVEAAGKAHYDEVIEKLSAARMEWGPGHGGFTPEAAFESAVEYEVGNLCQDLAHVRDLNAQALVALQEFRGAQSILANALAEERRKRIAAEKRTDQLGNIIAPLPKVGEEITIVNTGREEIDGVTGEVVKVFDRDRTIHVMVSTGRLPYSLQWHQWKAAPAEPKAIEGEPWTENISEGYDGRINLPIVTKGGEPGAHTLDFQIRERCEPDPELVMDGFLKWDGCLNVTFSQTEDNCMTHFCDPVDVDHFRDALQWVWTQGPKITHWDRCNELTEAIAKVVPPGAVPVAMHSGEIEGEEITVTPCHFTFEPVDGVVMDGVDVEPEE